MPQTPAAQTTASTQVGSAFGGAAPTGLNAAQTAAFQGVQQAFAPKITATSPVPTTPVNPTTPTVPNQTPKPQTAFSSDQGAQYASENSQTLATLKNTGLTVGQDGLARYSDQSFATAPSDAVQNQDGTWQSSGVSYALGPATSVDPELQSMNDQITQMKTQFDTTSRAMIDNIKSQFDSLIKQQTDANTRGQASLDQSLLMGGSSRYAQQSSAGQSTAMMSYGLGQIADLNTKEQTAVLNAQQAQDAGDMKLMDQSLQIAQQARSDKQAAAQKLSDALVKANTDLKAKAAQASQEQAVSGIMAQGVTDPSQIQDLMNNYEDGSSTGTNMSLDDINKILTNLNPNQKAVTDVMTSAAKNGATPDVLKAIGAATTVAGALAAAGNTIIDPTTPLGQYQSYVNQAQTKGQVPVSYQEWTDANKAHADAQAVKQAGAVAYASAAGKNAADNANPTTNTTSGSIAGDVKDILEGRNTLFNIRQTMGRSSSAAAYMQSVRDQIRTADPNFDFVQSDAGGKSVSTSYVQKGMAAIDTVLPNVQKVVDLSDQVTRLGVAPVDALLQKGGVMINNEKVSNFHEAQKLIADEIGVALGAGTVSDMKLQLGFDITDPSVSPQVFASNMGIVKEFLENRKAGLNDLRYKSSTVGDGTNTVPMATTKFLQQGTTDPLNLGPAPSATTSNNPLGI